MARIPRMPAMSLPARTLVFFSYLAIFYGAYSWVGPGGWWRPSGGGEDLWFLSVTGLVAIRLIETPFFRKPADSLVAVLIAGFALWAVDFAVVDEPYLLERVRTVAIAYFAIILVSSLVAISLLRRDLPLTALHVLPYRVSTRLGTPELLFTPSVLISLLGFHEVRTEEGLVLLAGWLIVATSRPLEVLVRWFGYWRQSAGGNEPRQVGTINRIDAPNLVRVHLDDPASWSRERPLLARLPSGTHHLLLPLFTQVRDRAVIGTGLAVSEATVDQVLPIGRVYRHPDPPDRASIMESIIGSGESGGEIVGFVVEGADIASIRFEVTSEDSLTAGLVVFCVTRGARVYYQIVTAVTDEETFERNPLGRVRVSATQLGIPDRAGGFSWHPWVPEMNSPVFRSLDPPELSDEPGETEGDAGLRLGLVPGTNFPVHLRWRELASHHGAVLGMTGMGKTELVFDLIREGVRNGAKIMCVDFTGEYEGRLADLGPVHLGLSPERLAELDEFIMGVETGEYAAGEEKRQLSGFLRRIHPEVAAGVDEFLRSEGPGVAIFALDDIANTRVTLRATELYLSEIFRWARNHRRAREILLVLEEAHTVVPEFNLFPRDRSDTMAVVGRIAQIALQGRKYGVGLLLVSQRTALVSKTVLSQCNTFFAFSLVDQTSLGFLENVFGRDHLSAIPNLQRRQLVVHGPGVVSERPIIAEIPFDPAKAVASAALDFAGSLEAAQVTLEVEEDGAENDDDDDGGGDLPF